VPVGGIAEAGTELHDPFSARGASEYLEGHADVAAHDREAVLLRVGLHLEEDGLVESPESILHIALDPRVDDVHGPERYRRRHRRVDRTPSRSSSCQEVPDGDRGWSRSPFDRAQRKKVGRCDDPFRHRRR
jgi:hypothetical protein